MENAKFLNLNKHDFLKGLLVAVITAVLTTLLQIVESGGVMLSAESLQITAKIALTTAIGYLLKNMLTNSEGKPLSTEPKKEESEG